MKTRVIVLAAGKGKRMKSEVPKVLIPFDGQPLVKRLLDSIKDSGVDTRPVLIVSETTGPLLKESLGDQYDYVLQTEQLGTGHAVKSAESLLENRADRVIVFYGDHPFLTKETIKKLDDLHETHGGPLAMITTTVQDFEGWRSLFRDFGRIKRDSSEDIESSVEMKDATPEERLIKEVNPCFFSFEASWLWDHLKKLENKNAQGEYYLTDLVHMAIKKGHPISSMNVNPLESFGVKTPEQL
ncbi:MAG: NTP transferase domain-containing protein, partial [Patescibacteria group bacterium]